MNFKSDNIVGVHPQIMDAIVQANNGVEPSYGNDSYSKALTATFSEIFEKPVTVYLASSGTAANCLALSAISAPYGAIYCHGHAHINVDEGGAPELFTGGAKLIPVPGDHGKIDPKALKDMIETAQSMRPHTSKPSCISLSQATESGTTYSLTELIAITDVAKAYGLPVHMDGARFANSLVHLGVTPAEATWKAGIDVMSFGATKNGAMSAEAIVFFNSDYANDFDYRQKRAGQMMSKMRFFACQFLAYFRDDLWLQNAAIANNAATALGNLFKKYNFKIEHPVEANEVFVHLPSALADMLLEKSGGFYEWGTPGCGLYRFVTSCFTTAADIETLEAYIAKHSEAQG
jgi:threonine aldolase